MNAFPTGYGMVEEWSKTQKTNSTADEENMSRGFDDDYYLCANQREITNKKTHKKAVTRKRRRE